MLDVNILDWIFGSCFYYVRKLILRSLLNMKAKNFAKILLLTTIKKNIVM